MLACFDVDYKENKARCACLVFEDWKAAVPDKAYTKEITPIADYESGQFYKRELPCLLAVLELVEESLSFIIVDSYVWLNSEGKAGMGAYLYEALQKKIPIIGVAKNKFKEENNKAVPILRGESQKALFITAAGVELKKAATFIQEMHGLYRFPDLLKQVDQLARAWEE